MYYDNYFLDEVSKRMDLDLSLFESYIDNEDELFEESDKGIIDKISEFNQNLINRFKEFVHKKSTSESVKKVEDKIKEDPQKKMVITKAETEDDHKQAMKALQELETTDNPEEVVIKYKKQRNTAIKSTVAVTLIGAAAVVFIKKFSNKQIADADARAKKYGGLAKKLKAQNATLKAQNANLTERNNKLKTTAHQLKNELDKKEADTIAKKARLAKKKLSNNASHINNDIKSTIDLNNRKIKAGAEIIETAAKGGMSAVNDTINSISKAANSGGANKVANTAKAASSVVKTPGNVLNNIKDSAKNAAKQSFEEMKEEAKGLKEKIDKCKKIINSSKATEEQKEKARNYLKKFGPRYKKLMEELRSSR